MALSWKSALQFLSLTVLLTMFGRLREDWMILAAGRPRRMHSAWKIANGKAVSKDPAPRLTSKSSS